MENKRVGQIIFKTSNKLRRYINKSLLEFGVTGVQSRTLNFIYRNRDKRDIYQKDVECFLALRGSTTTELITGLIDLGFIVRTRSKKDRRKKKIDLTKKGEEIAIETIKIFNELEKEFIERVSEEKYKEFMKVLISFEEIIDKKEQQLR